MTDSKPAVIALNGPPGSGKSGIALKLKQLIPDAIILCPSHELYLYCQEQGLAPRGMRYDDFKRRPESRRILIKASEEARASDYNIWERRVTESAAFRMARVVIIDNVGHTPTEFEYYDRHSRVSILVRIDTPYNEIEPLKSRSRRLKTVWPGDSRVPVEHHTMLTAYDFQQMNMLLEWLSRPLTREEAGPYHGIHQLWRHHFFGTTGESTGSVQELDAGASGQLGRLGQTALAERTTA